ncbi:sigma-70 family RNA polymerase sigma factor [Paenibacillus qinlingensis]|uniref:sigma-70 family RNA polymerase sigma factor n=1 Tax=Paenibacillus qinlingensis TaxID=1837343 RepID=UPI00156670A3|nr:sigma-70 family RNA polymerase sigma factor [Paenibacillus qinlingensis]NQX63827.1 sigma-70 family RNA polymerase sigma factor [Paenibacillus qinlingensis]
MNVKGTVSSSDPLYDIYEKKKIYKETGCQEAATVLLLHYEPIVRMAVSKMSRSRPDLYEDLFQVGQMSMLRLFTQYDHAMEVPFEGYAMKSLIGHLKNYLRDKSWYIQVPRRIKEKGAQMGRALDELTAKLERSPNVDEIAAYLELSTEETMEILAGRDYYHYTSLDTPLTSEGDGATIGDMIAGTTDDYQAIERRMDLAEAMDCLKDEERTVIGMIYQEGQSQRQIADQLGISQMSVSRIQKRAMTKLKTALTSNV